jgi:hypothetical protein
MKPNIFFNEDFRRSEANVKPHFPELAKENEDFSEKSTFLKDTTEHTKQNIGEINGHDLEVPSFNGVSETETKRNINPLNSHSFHSREFLVASRSPNARRISNLSALRSDKLRSDFDSASVNPLNLSGINGITENKSIVKSLFETMSDATKNRNKLISSDERTMGEEQTTESCERKLLIENKNNNSFHKIVKEYVKKYNPSLYILTPCFGGVNYVNYTISLINTINLFREFNIPLHVSFCKNDSLVSRARNNLIAKALYDEKTTHCMFIDNDITWDPNDILKLLIGNKPLIGGIYPLKKYHWDKITSDNQIIPEWLSKKKQSQLNTKISDEDYIQNRMLNYNVNYLEPVLKIVDNLAKVRHIATGFMLIQRNTLLEMMKAFSFTKYTDDVGFLKPHENKYAYALFDCGVEDNHYFSEDWLFCHRWSKMGGEVYIDVTINLTHTGIEDYNGSYISSIL